MPVDEAFLQALRDALNHLYDPDYLRRCPLASRWGLAGRYDAASALRRTLTEAIESLEPPPDEPPYSRAWRLYNALHFLYVQQMPQDEAADQLAISSRQLRREQAAGVALLAEALWQRLDPAGTAPEAEARRPAEEPAAAPESTSVRSELAWLQTAGQATVAELGEALPAVVEMARGLAGSHDARLEVETWPPLPRLSLHPVALRQILLSLLRLAIPFAAGGQARLSVRQLGDQVEIDVRCQGRPGVIPATIDAPAVDAARELIELCGCDLTLETWADGCLAVLRLPASEQVPVLLVDDNPDALQLLQRYAAGTRYSVLSTTNPVHIPALIEKHSPRLIVLDVMMPELDGWEVLARLRQDPRSSGIPVIICSVLADEELALTLGASLAVRKPITQAAFLESLDRVLAGG